MAQEDKELLLKDLCARLPYGVKVQRYSNENDIETIETLREIDSDGYMSTLECETFTPILKPYLRPMSSMTGVETLEYLSLKESIVASDDITYSFETYKSIDWLNKNMFDYRGLIPMRFANDATGKNIY